jgi:hypothetical protein
VGTVQALGLGGCTSVSRWAYTSDNNGRQWQTNEVEMEVELEKGAEGNVILLLREDGSPVRDPQTARIYATHRSKNRKTTYATCNDVGSSQSRR